MFRKISLYALVLAIFVSTCLAQPDTVWSHQYGNHTEQCRTALRSDEGYLLGGVTASFGQGECPWLIRTNERGDSVWSRAYEGFIADCNSLIQCHGGFAFAGDAMKPDVFGLDFKFTKINSDGDVIYSRFYGGASHEYCRSIIQTADDGFMLIGSTMSFGAGDIDWWIIKINADGDSIWSRTYGGLWSDKCNSIIEMPDGGFVLAGNYGSDCWAIKINADGDSIWSRTYEIGGHNFCESAILTTDGRIALVGSAYSHNPDNWDAWLLLINENGDSLLSCLYENNGNNDCNSIIEMPDGGFVLAGNTTSFGANNKDFWLIRTGSRGNILWSKTYGTEEYEECRSLIENPDGSYTLAGSKGPTDLYSANMWLVKTGIDQLSTQVMPLIPVGTLLQVFPNPFNSSAIIHYAVPPGFEQVSLLLVDPYGREVNKLFNGPATGDFHITINGQNLPSGFYFLQLQSSSSTTIMQKVTLIK